MPTSIQIDVVNCRLDGRVYVRKTIEKKFALRTREVRALNWRTIKTIRLNNGLAMLASMREGYTYSSNCHSVALVSASSLRVSDSYTSKTCYGIRRRRNTVGRLGVQPSGWTYIRN